jgi:hypothetical protein
MEDAVNYWRMRMRKENGGQDMFRQCLSQGLAAIYYTPVESINRLVTLHKVSSSRTASGSTRL